MTKRAKQPTGVRHPRALSTLASLATALLISTGFPALAANDDFPSWDDVQAAKSDEASAQAELERLTASIASAQAEVSRTQEEANRLGTEYAEAQDAYDEQVRITQKIQQQRTEAQEEAEKAQNDSGQLIASLAKAGGGASLTTGLLGDTGDADGYLFRIGMMQKLSERSSAVYQHAIQLRNTAQSLADQEEIAQGILEQLKTVAEEKFALAQAAAQVAATRYAALQEAQAKAQALVAYLTEKREVTEADYLEGIRQQWASDSAGEISVVEISAGGWARPTSGHVTSQYGPRTHPVKGFHTGVDIADGCSKPIYAAHAGVVIFAGWYGTWGNYIKIDHQDGTDSGYAHIEDDGIGVSIGQAVAPGQLIARTGNTGLSFGCHLHFIIRINDALTDPVPFMRDRGVTIS